MQSTRYFWLLFVLATSNRPDHVLASESDADAPFSVAAVLVHKQAFDRPHDVELQGDLAFVPGKGGSLAIVDVTDPTKPQLLWHRHDTKGLDDAETVLPSRDQLFLGTHDFISIDTAIQSNRFLPHASPRCRRFLISTGWCAEATIKERAR